MAFFTSERPRLRSLSLSSKTSPAALEHISIPVLPMTPTSPVSRHMKTASSPGLLYEAADKGVKAARRSHRRPQDAAPRLPGMPIKARSIQDIMVDFPVTLPPEPIPFPPVYPPSTLIDYTRVAPFADHPLPRKAAIRTPPSPLDSPIEPPKQKTKPRRTPSQRNVLRRSSTVNKPPSRRVSTHKFAETSTPASELIAAYRRGEKPWEDEPAVNDLIRRRVKVAAKDVRDEERVRPLLGGGAGQVVAVGSPDPVDNDLVHYQPWDGLKALGRKMSVLRPGESKEELHGVEQKDLSPKSRRGDLWKRVRRRLSVSHPCIEPDPESKGPPPPVPALSVSLRSFVSPRPSLSIAPQTPLILPRSRANSRASSLRRRPSMSMISMRSLHLESSAMPLPSEMAKEVAHSARISSRASAPAKLRRSSSRKRRDILAPLSTSRPAVDPAHQLPTPHSVGPPTATFREMSPEATSAPALSETQKAALWDALLRRSDRAGGTLEVKIQGGIGDMQCDDRSVLDEK